MAFEVKPAAVAQLEACSATLSPPVDGSADLEPKRLTWHGVALIVTNKRLGTQS